MGEGSGYRWIGCRAGAPLRPLSVGVVAMEEKYARRPGKRDRSEIVVGTFGRRQGSRISSFHCLVRSAILAWFRVFARDDQDFRGRKNILCEEYRCVAA